MSPLPDDEPNPYQAPQADVRPQIALTPEALRQKLLRRFRQQRLALAFAWIVVGGYVAWAGSFLSMAAGIRELGLLLLALGALWILAGILAWCGQYRAIWLGLATSYLAGAALIVAAIVASVVTPFLLFLLCALIPLFGIIRQAHRVLRWARELEADNSP